jgi:hypothetical protein
MSSTLSWYITIIVIGLAMALLYRHLMIKVLMRLNNRILAGRKEAKQEIEYLKCKLEKAIDDDNIVTRSWLQTEIARKRSAWQL